MFGSNLCKVLNVKPVTQVELLNEGSIDSYLMSLLNVVQKTRPGSLNDLEESIEDSHLSVDQTLNNSMMSLASSSMPSLGGSKMFGRGDVGKPNKENTGV